ncbi:MAG TPA: hypothetical protein VGH19_14790 [Verrucomicrobiae bacterium]
MNKEISKVRFSWIEFSCFLLLFFATFRMTYAIAFVLCILAYLSFNWHRSNHLIHSATALIGIAFLLPIDIHIPGVSSPILESTHRGPRLVEVGYGFPRLAEGKEFAAVGCAQPLYPDKWRLVWFEEK